MGYANYYSGKISISPPMPSDLVDDLNAFLEERHEGDDFPSPWSDLEVIDDGSKLTWNGNDSSHDLEYWIKWLIERKFLMYNLNGAIEVQGADPDDAWSILVEDNVVYTQSYILIPDPATRVAI